MQESKKSPLRIGVLLFDEFSNHCLANLVEPLRAANGFAGRRVYDWQHLTLEGAPVVSSSGLRIAPDGRLSQAFGDILLAIPSYGYRRHATAACLSGLRAAQRRFGTLGGLDTGAWLLAAAGLLTGRSATIHWDELAAFAEAFPEVAAQRERFVIDGDRITGTGAMASFDLIMHLIAQRGGEALRQDVAALFMSGERPAAGPADRTVARALGMMRANLETTLTIGQLARALGVSQKTLETRMRAALGATPQAAYRRERLMLARRLVRETALSVAEIAVRCGYGDPAALTRAFRGEFATTPRAMRSGQLA